MRACTIALALMLAVCGDPAAAQVWNTYHVCGLCLMDQLPCTSNELEDPDHPAQHADCLILGGVSDLNACRTVLQGQGGLYLERRTATCQSGSSTARMGASQCGNATPNAGNWVWTSSGSDTIELTVALGRVTIRNSITGTVTRECNCALSTQPAGCSVDAAGNLPTCLSRYSD